MKHSALVPDSTSWSRIRARSRAHAQKKELDRIQGLVKRGDVEQRIVDESADRYASAHSAIKRARSQVLVANGVLAEARARIAEAKADLVEARSNLNIAESGLHSAEIVAGYTKIDAPFDGIVTRRNFQVGDLVRSPNAGNVKPIVTVVQTQRMRVVVDVPEDDAPLLDEGDRAKVRIGGLGARAVYQGQIARPAYALDPVERTVRAEIDLPNTDGRLRPGESGIVTIVLAVKENVLTIPGSAIAAEDADGMTVCYRAVAGRAVRSRIRIGDRDDGTRFEVLEGLKEGDVVIAEPGAALVDGQAIRIQRDEEKPAGQ
jgi:HlyD family secretion protein